MTDERLVRSMAIALDDLAAARTPDYLEAAIERASSRPQRPSWTFPERWLPMDLATSRVRTPGLPWRQLGVLALIALLLAVALAAYVGSQRASPAPFGVAANGLVAYVDADGAILQTDPATGLAEVLVPGPGNERPTYSPDGSRLAYLREQTDAGHHIVVASADGANPVVITTEPTVVDFLGWSPDSKTIVVSVPPGQLQTYDASTPSAPRVLSADGKPIRITGIDSFNADIRDLFRPPTGNEILYIGATFHGRALFVANADGSGSRAIIDPETSAIPYSGLDTPQWSPDGTRIAFALRLRDEAESWRIYIVNADGTGLRELSKDPQSRSEGHPSWSPDGTRVAFQRWYEHPDDEMCGFCLVRPITVVGVDDGVETEVGIVNVDGYHGWSWSPDGMSILQLAQNVAERRVQIAPADGDAPLFLDATPASAPNWQRDAP